MKILLRRSSLLWSSLTFGLFFGLLTAYALATGDAFVPGRHGSQSKHILAASDPRSYELWVRAYTLFTAAVCSLRLSAFH
jgi:hypothetical protein